MKKTSKKCRVSFYTLADLFLSKRDIAAARETFEPTLQLAPKDLNVLVDIVRVAAKKFPLTKKRKLYPLRSQSCIRTILWL